MSPEAGASGLTGLLPSARFHVAMRGQRVSHPIGAPGDWTLELRRAQRALECESLEAVADLGFCPSKTTVF